MIQLYLEGLGLQVNIILQSIGDILNMILKPLHLINLWRGFDFFSLLLYSYDKQVLARIRNLIRRTLHVDELTFGTSQGKFAYVSIELYLKKSLIFEFIFDDKVHKVEYEGSHIICFECGIFSHKQESYPRQSKQANSKANGDGSTLGTDDPLHQLVEKTLQIIFNKQT